MYMLGYHWRIYSVNFMQGNEQLALVDASFKQTVSRVPSKLNLRASIGKFRFE